MLNPKGSNRVGPQTVIDLPAVASAEAGLPAQAGRDGEPVVVGQPFFLAGWAADLDSTVDGGVDTVHVWAYRVRAAGWDAPRFLGAAVYGGPRPDVAAIYGERFRNSGYGLGVDGLESGTYDLAVFAYSTVRGGFVPAKLVRVTVR